MKMIRSICRHDRKKRGSWRRKRTRCHGNVPVIRHLVEISVQKKDDGNMSVSCKDGGVLPVTRFPLDNDRANEGHNGHDANI